MLSLVLLNPSASKQRPQLLLLLLLPMLLIDQRGAAGQLTKLCQSIAWVACVWACTWSEAAQPFRPTTASCGWRVAAPPPHFGCWKATLTLAERWCLSSICCRPHPIQHSSTRWRSSGSAPAALLMRFPALAECPFTRSYPASSLTPPPRMLLPHWLRVWWYLMTMLLSVLLPAGLKMPTVLLLLCCWWSWRILVGLCSRRLWTLMPLMLLLLGLRHLNRSWAQKQSMLLLKVNDYLGLLNIFKISDLLRNSLQPFLTLNSLVFTFSMALCYSLIWQLSSSAILATNKEMGLSEIRRKLLQQHGWVISDNGIKKVRMW
jgi:hypothetical protein